MGNLRISINDIPPQGQTIVVDEPSVWTAPIEEFQMDCRITTPLQAKVLLLPTDGGCLVRGSLHGAVETPCDRCAESTPITIEHKIEIFTCLPDHNSDPEDTESDDAGHILLENGVPILDMAALCWEEFMLALPMRPLCSSNCKGLCATCGASLNEGTCHCIQESGDPRLAALRQLKVKKSG